MTNQKLIINIDDIENSSDKKLQVHVEDFIDGIKSEEPLVAELELTSLGDFIQISGYLQGKVVLECDLCLKEFNYELKLNLKEMFAKNTLMQEYSEEIELKEGQFITDLKGSNEIDLLDFLYQSVILDFPNKKVCDISCKGGDIFIRDENYTEDEIDPRMAVFKDIKVDGK